MRAVKFATWNVLWKKTFVKMLMIPYSWVMDFTKYKKQSGIYILIYLWIFVSLCPIVPNRKCLNFITFHLTNLFRGKITAMRRWTLIQHICALAHHDCTALFDHESCKKSEQGIVRQACESHKNDFYPNMRKLWWMDASLWKLCRVEKASYSNTCFFLSWVGGTKPSRSLQ